MNLQSQKTKKRYGETKYIFVREEDSTKPMKYGTLQNKIMAMIQKEQLKDGNGKLFGFNTHMFRHYYGLKITEMDLDGLDAGKAVRTPEHQEREILPEDEQPPSGRRYKGSPGAEIPDHRRTFGRMGRGI